MIPLVTGIAQACLLIFVRAASIRHPDATMDFVPALSALLTVAFAMAMAKLDGGKGWSASSLVTGLQPHFWLALFGCGLGVAGYNLACTVAPRYLTGAEVSLVLLFESVGGPLWVFVGYGDVPSPWTLASGALLIGALVGHEVAAMYSQDEDDDDFDSSPGRGLTGTRVPSISSPSLSFKKKQPPITSMNLDAVAYGVPLLITQDGRGADGNAAQQGRYSYEPPACDVGRGPSPMACGVERRTTT